MKGKKIIEGNMIKLILTDMDGTLLNSRHEMPAQTERIIRQLHQRGIRFGVASGREYENLRGYFGELAKEMIFIADNGTLVYDGEEEIYVDSFGQGEVEDIIQYLRQLEGVWIVLCGKDKTYVECDGKKTEQMMGIIHNFYTNIEMVDDACVLANHTTILEVSLFCEQGAESIYPKLDRFKERYQLFISGLQWIDILNKTAGKGNALKQIQAGYGWSKEECMCFGDYLNDVDMLQNAGISYAMANARPEVKAVAKFSAPSNEEGGVVTVLQEYFGLEEATAEVAEERK